MRSVVHSRIARLAFEFLFLSTLQVSIMGNAVAPEYNSASAPVNPLLSSTAELDPSLIAISPSPAAPFNGPLSSLPASTTVDIPPPVLLDDLSPLQLLFYAADTDDCDLIRTAVSRGANISAPDLGRRAQDEERKAQEEREGKAKGKAKGKGKGAGEDSSSLYKDLVVTMDTALHKAAALGNVKALELLLFLNADTEAHNIIGSTPLHRAVSCQKIHAVHLLMGKDVRLDAVNLIGNTPLHVASYQGDLDIAQALLTHARQDAYRLVVACNNAGLTPLDYARKKAMQALLSSFRPTASRTNSFVDHSHQDAMATPKGGGGGMGWGVVGGDAAGGASHHPTEPSQPNSRRASARALGAFRSQDGLSAHSYHHFPNPPLSIASRTQTTHTLHSMGSNEPVPETGGAGDPPPFVSVPSIDKSITEPSLTSHTEEERAGSVVGSMASSIGPVGIVTGLKGRQVSVATLSALSLNMANEDDGGAGEEKEPSRQQGEPLIRAAS